MASTNNKTLLPEFERIKDDNEEILWTGKPKFIPFIFGSILAGFATFAFLVICLLTVRGFGANSTDNSFSSFGLFGFIPLILGAFTIMSKILSFPNTVYAYSDKRVMMRTGFLRTNFKTIDYDKISDIEVIVGIVENRYNTGTIRFFSGRTQTNEDGRITKLYDNWSAIENPYGVYKMVKQTSVNIKTDFNYPNDLRPDTNPDHNTKYDAK